MLVLHSSENELFVVSRHAMKFSRFAEIPSLSGAHMPALRDASQRHGLTPVGPEVFIYTFQANPHGGRRPIDGNFILEMGIPIAGEKPGLPPEFEYKRVSLFRYISLRTSDFSQWTSLRNTAELNGLRRTLIEREVYLHDTVELQEGVE
jgi:hypothetical protein